VKRIAIVILALLAFGAARLPFERALDEEHRTAFFRGAKLDLGLREQIGQGGFIAALSGFRSVVADLLWIQANTAWQNTEWGRMVVNFDAVTTLQPRVILFWEMAAWHMAWNASNWARDNPKQPREALRIKAQREYFELGRLYLERGIRNNPDKYVLYDRMGLLLRDKLKDHYGAYQAYAKAAEFPDAPSYEKRFAAYELSQVPGKEKEAYEMLTKLYHMGEQERLPTLLTRIGELQEKLDIPQDQRIYIAPEKNQ
jgi:hypothetical protein